MVGFYASHTEVFAPFFNVLLKFSSNFSELHLLVTKEELLQYHASISSINKFCSFVVAQIGNSPIMLVFGLGPFLDRLNLLWVSCNVFR